jgi:nucleoside-diphosphate-sugar epimerase
MTPHRILITGANGFIGRHLCRHLTRQGKSITACIRPSSNISSLAELPKLELLRISELTPHASSWPALGRHLAEVDAIVHLAARVHVMHDTSADPLAAFREANVTTTECLARAAAESGVRRFIYVSSIKVNGEATEDSSYTADDRPAYVDPYGQSKWEAEQKLEEIATAKGMEWVVVRPPLVYGPGVRGNFLALMKCLLKGYPLPLGAVENRRSVVSVYNLADLLERTLYHPNASGQRFLVKDEEDISTAELVRRLGNALQRQPRLIPVPPRLLLASGKLLRKQDVIQRLCSSLVLNTTKTADLLDWRARVSLDSGLGRTCEWFQTATLRGAL